MAKLLKQEGESAKVSIRQARKNAMDVIKRLDGEDDRKKAEKQVTTGHLKPAALELDTLVTAVACYVHGAGTDSDRQVYKGGGQPHCCQGKGVEKCPVTDVGTLPKPYETPASRPMLPKQIARTGIEMVG